MIPCDSCGNPLQSDSLITVMAIVHNERQSFVVCSPDCLTDYVARLYAVMIEKGLA